MRSKGWRRGKVRLQQGHGWPLGVGLGRSPRRHCALRSKCWSHEANVHRYYLFANGHAANKRYSRFVVRGDAICRNASERLNRKGNCHRRARQMGHRWRRRTRRRVGYRQGLTTCAGLLFPWSSRRRDQQHIAVALAVAERGGTAWVTNVFVCHRNLVDFLAVDWRSYSTT